MLMCLVSILSSILKQKDKEHNSEFFLKLSLPCSTWFYFSLLLPFISLSQCIACCLGELSAWVNTHVFFLQWKSGRLSFKARRTSQPLWVRLSSSTVGCSMIQVPQSDGRENQTQNWWRAQGDKRFDQYFSCKGGNCDHYLLQHIYRHKNIFISRNAQQEIWFYWLSMCLL